MVQLPAEDLTEMLSNMKRMQDMIDEQQKEIGNKKKMVVMQQRDTTKLHVNSYVQKAAQREIEKKAEMVKYSNPNIKRCWTPLL